MKMYKVCKHFCSSTDKDYKCDHGPCEPNCWHCNNPEKEYSWEEIVAEASKSPKKLYKESVSKFNKLYDAEFGKD